MAVVSSSSSFLSFSHGGVHRRCHLSCLRRGKVSSAAFSLSCSQSELHATSISGDSDPVEVIGIGSRKDSVIDFCLSSSLLSSSLSRLRFWTMHSKDSSRVQLIQRCQGTDAMIRDLEFPLSIHPLPSTLILVASTGHGLEHITATELLSYVKSKGILAISIVLRPFSFEGRRRQEEADNLIRKLQESSNFYIVIDADSLLKTEAETLSEAFESANNAVILSISMISAMTLACLLLETSPNQPTKEISPSEAIKLLEGHGEARISFGAGYSTKSAIKQAICNNLYLGSGIKVSNGVVFITVTAASLLEKSDLVPIIRTFRRMSNFGGEVICSKIFEPGFEPRLTIITLLAVGCERSIEPEKGFLSGLALRIPFLSRFITRQETPELENEFPQNDVSTLEKKQAETADMGTMSESYKQTIEASQNEGTFWSFGPGFHMAKLWAQERDASKASKSVDGIDMFTIPVGVKSSGSRESMQGKSCCDSVEPTSFNAENALCKEESGDSGLGTVLDICNSAVELIKGRSIAEPRKQGLLSNRAASMLEAERETEKTWSPVVQIEYKGGIYKGRCQCGIPEGKGCLTFADGSIYDGMWRNGKRFGVGTFYYSNGDVFHGTWRDDLIHGKGWYYFEGGDRWFSNFWKGRANGEGRFYSRDGSIIFCHFQNGWRHGESLYVDANGSRWSEIWDDGVLISHTALEN
ncbi:hypothetical protein LUZ63_011253 [Rhynchospora breviuscula]|uniref:Protein ACCUMULATION AND REPLICATION OF CHLOROPLASTS 3 n=1 Tax=Rhynchospora breviuscula TaxID=2022672 RepID=A0A9Q0CIM6_9POAL|nr:hypothetical protein LUZ63_011253 [Rhynchospora breviuscula]